MPDDDELRLVVGDEAGDLGEARLGRGLADDAHRPREGAARVGDGDSGAGGAVVERDDAHYVAIEAEDQALGLGERVGKLRRVLPACPGHRATAAAAAADEQRCALDDIGGTHPVGDRIVEVGDQGDLAVFDASEHDRGRAVALLEAVGEIEQRVSVEPLDRLDDEVEAVLGSHDRLDVASIAASGSGACGRLALQLLARLLELRAGRRRARASGRAAVPTPRRR